MSDQPRRGRLFVLSGPSAVGKDTVIARLLQMRPQLGRPPAYTTRPIRQGEVQDQDYSFIDEPSFATMLAQGRFLETALVHGRHYGTDRERVEQLLRQGRDVLLKPDVQGAARLRQLGLGDRFIFLLPPSRQVLLERLERRRTEDPKQLELRIRAIDSELAESSWYDERVVNDEVERAAAQIAEIVDRERATPN